MAVAVYTYSSYIIHLAQNNKQADCKRWSNGYQFCSQREKKTRRKEERERLRGNKKKVVEWAKKEIFNDTTGFATSHLPVQQISSSFTFFDSQNDWTKRKRAHIDIKKMFFHFVILRFAELYMGSIRTNTFDQFFDSHFEHWQQELCEKYQNLMWNNMVLGSNNTSNYLFKMIKLETGYMWTLKITCCPFVCYNCYRFFCRLVFYTIDSWWFLILSNS